MRNIFTLKHLALVLLIVILGLGIFLVPKLFNVNVGVTNFQECIDAGNPAMESYPRQCMAGDRTFVEIIDECTLLFLEECSDGCSVCPPCEECSSILCQSSEVCEGLGFDEDWYDGVR